MVEPIESVESVETVDNGLAKQCKLPSQVNQETGGAEEAYCPEDTLR